LVDLLVVVLDYGEKEEKEMKNGVRTVKRNLLLGDISKFSICASLWGSLNN